MKKNVALLFLIFFEFIMLGEKLQAQLNSDSLINLINTSTNTNILIDAYNDYGAQLYRSKTDSAIYYALKALNLAEEEGNNSEIFASYNLLGLSYQTKGVFNLSLEYFNKALKYEPNAILNKAKTYHNIALTYLMIGDNTNALKSEMQAIEISEKSKDPVLIGVIYQSMCNIYRNMHEYDQAEKYIIKSIDILEKIPDGSIDNKLSMLANAYGIYGNLLLADNHVEEAIEKHKIGLQMHSSSGDLFNKAIIMENLGDDYKRLKKYSESLNYYNSAKDIMQQLDSETDVGYELMNIADIYKETGKYSEALNNLDSALHIFERTGADSYRSDVYFNKYLVFELIDNPSAALLYIKNLII